MEIGIFENLFENDILFKNSLEFGILENPENLFKDNILKIKFWKLEFCRIEV